MPRVLPVIQRRFRNRFAILALKHINKCLCRTKIGASSQCTWSHVICLLGFITGYYRIILHGPEPLIACLTVITKQSRLTGWLSCLMTFSTILCIDGFQFKACLLSQIQGLFGRTGSQVILFPIQGNTGT